MDPQHWFKGLYSIPLTIIGLDQRLRLRREQLQQSLRRLESPVLRHLIPIEEVQQDLEGLVQAHKELGRLPLLDALVEDVGEGVGGHGPHHGEHALKVGRHEPVLQKHEVLVQVLEQRAPVCGVGGGGDLALEEESFDVGCHLGADLLEDGEDLVLDVLDGVLHEGADGLPAGVRHQTTWKSGK